MQRAEKYLAGVPSMGCYTDSQGMVSVREDIASFLKKRDGYEANTGNIFVTNGASEGVRLCMQTITRSATSGHKDGVLTPIPQYPLYSALSTLLSAHLVPYYLDESNNWSCTVENLTRSLENSIAQGISPRALVVINPGNPTGQVLSESNMREIVQFCCKNNICLMADEVYQDNIWKKNAKFVSFRKVAYDMKAFDNGLQLISFHSVSKGFYGECGLRGGYFEMIGIPDDVRQEIYKLASISLCSNTIGQVTMGLVMTPPAAGEPSYATYVSERDGILSSLNRRSVKLHEGLNKLEGVSCNSIDGAMYAFPTITLPGTKSLTQYLLVKSLTYYIFFI